MSRPMYDISERYRNLLELCDNETVDKELLETALQVVEGEIEDKVRNGIGLIQELKYRAESYETEIKRLSQLKKSVENSIERIQAYYLENLLRTGKTKVWTERGTMSVIKSGGKRPLKIDDEEIVPTEFKKNVMQTLIDKDAVRDALEKGLEVAGAHLDERGQYLRIY